jgi:CDGSH-type Zn-finger protein
MSQVTIKVRDNGPFLVEGPVTVMDAAGGVFQIPAGKPAIALCRCGQSSNKPFCDGSHKTCNFVAAQRAPAPLSIDSLSPAPPQPPGDPKQP